MAWVASKSPAAAASVLSLEAASLEAASLEAAVLSEEAASLEEAVLSEEVEPQAARLRPSRRRNQSNLAFHTFVFSLTHTFSIGVRSKPLPNAPAAGPGLFPGASVFYSIPMLFFDHSLVQFR